MQVDATYSQTTPTLPCAEIVRERIEGKTRFKLAGYYVDGRRVRKYFATEAGAKTFVAAENIRRTNLGNRATRIDGALAEDALRAAEALKDTPYPLLDAARIVAQAHAQLAPFGARIEAAIIEHAKRLQERRRSMPARELVNEYIENRRAKGKSKIYIRDLETRLGRFAAAMGGRLMSDITTLDIDRWIQSLNVGPQTQNNFRAVLSSAWTFAVRRGYAANHVVQLVDKSEVVRDHVPVFSPEQIEGLLTAAPPEYVPVLAIGAFAGLRPEELNKLRWDNLDFEERTIAVNASAAKTKKALRRNL